MNKLEEYKLDFSITMEYVKDNIEGLTTFSKELLLGLNFELGRFFTLLPSNVNLPQLYNFTVGGVLPQNPRIPYSEVENKGSYQYISNLQEEITFFIFNKINNEDLLGIFEDFLRTTEGPYRNFNGIHRMTRRLNEEIYYVAKKENSKVQIEKCLRKANAIWHSLCVLTRVNLRDPNEEELTLEDLQEASKNAEMIIVGAYDGEGYVFWERNRNFKPIFH